MAADFDRAFNLLMDLEVGSLPNGGYIPDDNGAGPCKWGWTERTLRRIGWIGHVRDLSRDESKRLTETHYWKRYTLDQVSSSRFATILLCQIFNQGAMVYSWQAAVGVIYVDGIIGPDTIAATNNCTYASECDTESVIRLFLAIAHMRYVRLAIANPARYADDLRGWKARLETLRVKA